jgi:hypothetical protein
MAVVHSDSSILQSFLFIPEYLNLSIIPIFGHPYSIIFLCSSAFPLVGYRYFRFTQVTPQIPFLIVPYYLIYSLLQTIAFK